MIFSKETCATLDSGLPDCSITSSSSPISVWGYFTVALVIDFPRRGVLLVSYCKNLIKVNIRSSMIPEVLTYGSLMF